MMGIPVEDIALPQQTSAPGERAEKDGGKKTTKSPLPLCSSSVKGYLTLDGYVTHRMSHGMAGNINFLIKISNFFI